MISFSLVAAACGSDDDSSSTEETSAPAESTATTGAAADTTAASTSNGGGGGEGLTGEVRWRTRPDNDAEAAVYQEISESIDASNGDVTLKYKPGTNEGSPYQDQLVTEIGNGTAPDVFWIPGTDIARFQKEGLILDLAPLPRPIGFDTRSSTRSRCTT